MKEPQENQPTHQSPIQMQASDSKEYIKTGDMLEAFTRDVLMRAFTDYSVALSRMKDGKPLWLGSGVLVKKGKHFGILTAHHCLHACSPEVRLGDSDGDTLCLVLNRGRVVEVKPQEVMEHVLVKPERDEFGPDLTFIEILSVERLGTFKAIGTFWSLDRKPCDVMQTFGTPFTPIASLGYPEFHYNTIRDGGRTRHQIRHMVYDNAIKEGDVFEMNGWDYLDTTIWYPGDAGLPPSFSGMSGGPVWGMELKRHKGDGHITIEKHALVGITFYEVFRQGDEGRLRSHFIKSIYDLAWKNFC